MNLKKPALEPEARMRHQPGSFWWIVGLATLAGACITALTQAPGLATAAGAAGLPQKTSPNESFSASAYPGSAMGQVAIPTGWTASHSAALISLLSALTAGMGVWGLYLRRQVQIQTEQLQQRLEREAALERSFRELIEQAHDLIFTVDVEGRFASGNAALRRALSVNAADLQQVPVHSVVSPECWETIQRLLQAEDASEAPLRIETQLRSSSGRELHLELSLRRTLGLEGAPVVECIGRDITTRKRMEAELFRSTQMLRMILDTTPQRIFWKDRNSVYLGCNRAFAADCGLSSPEAIVGKTDHDLPWRINADQYCADDQEVMTTGQPKLDYEEPQVRPDGSLAWLRTSKVPIRDAQGEIIGVLGTYEDVTAIRQAQEALAQASSLFQTMLEHCPDMIYFKDRQSRFVHYSRAFVERYNLQDPKALVGKTDFDIFTEEHARPAFEDEQTIMRTGQPIVGKLEKETHADGRVTWALTTKVPWRNAQGEIVGTFGISKDITQLKQAEDQLNYERELFQTLLDNIPDAIYFKDRQSRFVRFSRALLEKLPQVGGAQDLVGKTDFDIFTEEHARPAFEDEQRIIATGEPVIGKVEKETHKDGRVTWCLTTKMPWRNAWGEIIGTFGISKDITELKKAEAELEATHRRLVDASRLAGMAEVASDVLHNVGNVLTSINVSCSVLLDRIRQNRFANLAKVPQLLREHIGHMDEFLTQDPRGKHLLAYLEGVSQALSEQQELLLTELGQVRDHVEHIKQVVAMQQNYARLAGVEETIEPVQLMEDALRINAAALDRHTITLVREFEPAPPILVDRHKVLQILVNLIRNAKYAVSDSGRPDKRVVARIRREGEAWLVMEVEDNGVGIPAENLTRIFTHGFTTRPNGHGFGLHSSALAAKALGGSIHVHSDGPGKGARFTVRIPYKNLPTSS
ncbi:MAG: PAS domain-containing protein [Verrucomicrobiota bacterium]|nr:PAS domain-containing protein [Limisphaera sp.]MDW8381016.1 PAS domain-containing protein [Verrucomicrobiota bacterium]